MDKPVITQSGSSNIILGIFIAVIAAGVIGYVIFKAPMPLPPPPASPPTAAAGPVEMDGELVCLPSKRGTEECAIGLRGDYGVHYGLRDPDARFNLGLLGTEQTVHVSGKLAHASPEFLAIYDVAGTIEIHSLIQFQSKSSDKVVYAVSQSTDVEPLKQDCARRGGTFNTCGSPCASNAEVCAEVCAYTCEFKKGGMSPKP